MAGLIPDGELDAIRAVSDSTLDTWVTIQTPTLTDDGGGDVVRTWSGGVRVRARIGRETTGQRIMESEAMARDAIRDAQDWAVTLPAGTPVTIADRIATDDGRHLEVVAVDAARSYQLHTRARCRELR